MLPCLIWPIVLKKNFEVRNRYYQQKLEFGLDINDLDIGQLVLTTKDTKRDHNPWALFFNEVFEQQDATGTYKLLKETHRSNKGTIWSEEDIQKEIKSYLESRGATYIVNNTSGEPVVVKESNKKHKIIVISD